VGVHFFLKKVDDFFSRRQFGSLSGAPGGGGFSHSTTGTMVNPALVTVSLELGYLKVFAKKTFKIDF